ncbi:MAG: orotidine-5'-phosphate decarboxylase [Clostridiales bacterium]|jgi:orotidine-5'-phosphate decarboxylase|nr:orotidine-5'-phosphate decarboxylase [Clostridiales bacterium]
MSINQLISKIISKSNPTVAGLDPSPSVIPPCILEKHIGEYGCTLKAAAESVLEFNRGIIDALHDIVPAVKPQSAFYEMYGPDGIDALKKTIEYAKLKNLYVIADAKRGDIGSTAEAYAAAYLGKIKIGDTEISPFDADSLTVNAYLGSDGVKPFLDICKDRKKSIFILVKTSNPSSSEFQDLIAGTRTVYRAVAEKASAWGSDLIGEYGYSEVGFVVGATYPGQLMELRRNYQNTFFLVPGYGAQGAKAQDLAVAFDRRGLGAIVNSSRGIIGAWKNTGSKDGSNYTDAAREAAAAMKKDLETYCI